MINPNLMNNIRLT